MASTSPNVNTGTAARNNVVTSHNHQAPIPPARTHSRPNQPPPPPPLPSVPPVPPKRDSSITISQAAIGDSNIRHNTTASIPQPQSKTNNISDGANSHVISPKMAQQLSTQNLNGGSRNTVVGIGDGNFVSQFASLFRPISELPPPEPFMNRPKTYPSQRALQKQTITPRT